MPYHIAIDKLSKQPWEMTSEEYAWGRGAQTTSLLSGVPGAREPITVADDPIAHLSPEAFDVWQRAVAAAKTTGPGGVGGAVDASKTTSDDRKQLAAIGLSATTDRMSVPMMAIAQRMKPILMRRRVEHKRSVKQALSEDKPVPERVLAEYPGL